MNLGAPIPELNHADRICDMAMDMMDAITAIKDPSGGMICKPMQHMCF